MKKDISLSEFLRNTGLKYDEGKFRYMNKKRDFYVTEDLVMIAQEKKDLYGLSRELIERYFYYEKENNRIGGK